jgi:alpha-D-ribose 1-methylphosphonate 5-triphosphate synthase subunit PhnG
MFQTFDSVTDPLEDRKAWLALLARAPVELMVSATKMHTASIAWLRRPETGLFMVQGRIGGTGERFNFGEITVTRCTLRLNKIGQVKTPMGVSYVLGRSHEQAKLAAIADALLQDPDQRATLSSSLLEPIRAHLLSEQQKRNQNAQSTKVDFFTVARQSGNELEGK